jgi:hypothetical protein
MMRGVDPTWTQAGGEGSSKSEYVRAEFCFVQASSILEVDPSQLEANLVPTVPTTSARSVVLVEDDLLAVWVRNHRADHERKSTNLRERSLSNLRRSCKCR